MFRVFLVTASPGNPSSLVVLFVQINNTVTDLNLRYNKFGDAGAIAISEALKVSFVFFRERSPFFWLPLPPGNEVLYVHTGQRHCHEFDRLQVDHRSANLPRAQQRTCCMETETQRYPGH